MKTIFTVDDVTIARNYGPVRNTVSTSRTFILAITGEMVGGGIELYPGEGAAFSATCGPCSGSDAGLAVVANRLAEFVERTA